MSPESSRSPAAIHLRGLLRTLRGVPEAKLYMAGSVVTLAIVTWSATAGFRGEHGFATLWMAATGWTALWTRFSVTDRPTAARVMLPVPPLQRSLVEAGLCWSPAVALALFGAVLAWSMGTGWHELLSTVIELETEPMPLAARLMLTLALVSLAFPFVLVPLLHEGVDLFVGYSLPVLLLAAACALGITSTTTGLFATTGLLTLQVLLCRSMDGSSAWRTVSSVTLPGAMLGGGRRARAGCDPVRRLHSELWRGLAWVLPAALLLTTLGWVLLLHLGSRSVDFLGSSYAMLPMVLVIPRGLAAVSILGLPLGLAIMLRSAGTSAWNPIPVSRFELARAARTHLVVCAMAFLLLDIALAVYSMRFWRPDGQLAMTLAISFALATTVQPAAVLGVVLALSPRQRTEGVAGLAVALGVAIPVSMILTFPSIIIGSMGQVLTDQGVVQGVAWDVLSVATSIGPTVLIAVVLWAYTLRVTRRLLAVEAR